MDDIGRSYSDSLTGQYTDKNHQDKPLINYNLGSSVVPLQVAPVEQVAQVLPLTYEQKQANSNSRRENMIKNQIVSQQMFGWFDTWITLRNMV